MLQNVQVLAVGENPATRGSIQASARTVSLSLPPGQLARLTLALRFGKVSLAIRRPGDASIAPAATAHPGRPDSPSSNRARAVCRGSTAARHSLLCRHPCRLYLREQIAMIFLRVFQAAVIAGGLGCGTASADDAAARKTSPAQPEHVALGGQYLIAVDARPTRLALGDATIVDVKLLERQIRLVGLKAGSTDLTVWTKAEPRGHTYNIVVGPSVAALQAKLAAAPALKDVTAASAPDGVTLEGEVGSLDARQQAEAIAKSESGKDATDQLAVADRRMIAVEVRFAAVATNTMKTLGLNFQKLAGGFQFASAVPGSIGSFQFSPDGGLAVNSGLPLSQAFNVLINDGSSGYAGVISALSSVNLAQVLAEPTLLVRSGDDANFLAGGEYRFRCRSQVNPPAPSQFSIGNSAYSCMSTPP